MKELWALTKNFHAWDALSDYLKGKKEAIERSLLDPSIPADRLQRQLGAYELIHQLLKLRDQAEGS